MNHDEEHIPSMLKVPRRALSLSLRSLFSLLFSLSMPYIFRYEVLSFLFQLIFSVPLGLRALSALLLLSPILFFPRYFSC